MSHFQKLVSAAAIVLLLSGCGKGVDESFKTQQALGKYRGMDVTFVKDDTDEPARGFYILEDRNYSEQGQTNPDFTETKIGYHSNMEIYFIRDKTDSPAKGFYVFKDKQGQLVPTLSFGVPEQSGKTQTIKTTAVLFKSSELNAGKLPNVMIDGKSFNLNEMDEKELLAIAQSIKNLAQERAQIREGAGIMSGR